MSSNNFINEKVIQRFKYKNTTPVPEIVENATQDNEKPTLLRMKSCDNWIYLTMNETDYTIRQKPGQGDNQFEESYGSVEGELQMNIRLRFIIIYI